MAIRIPKVGELSRKERDDIKPMFVAKGGARVFEDFKRIENKFPDAGAKDPAEIGSAEADDLIVLVVGLGAVRSEDDHPAQKRKVTPAGAGDLRFCRPVAGRTWPEVRRQAWPASSAATTAFSG